MRRAAWIFFASILLPSLVLAWLAVRSVRDQQVVLEHQQAIICQNITDTLAKNIQGQMDGIRADFVKTTEQLLGEKGAPQILAQHFNRTLHESWPLAEIGFAVNLSGQIYSPTPYDGPEARTFRDENDRFLSNRENVQVYTANGNLMTQNSTSAQFGIPPNATLQNAAAQFALKLPVQVTQAQLEKKESTVLADFQSKLKRVDALAGADKDEQKVSQQEVAKSASRGAVEAAKALAPANAPTATGKAMAAPAAAPVAEADDSASTALPATPAMPAPVPAATTAPALDREKAASNATPAPAPAVAPAGLPEPTEAHAARLAPATPPPASGGEVQTIAVPSSTVTASPPPPAAPMADLPLSQTMAVPVASTSETRQKTDAITTTVTAGTANAPPPGAAQDGLWPRDEGQTPMPQVFTKIARNVVPQQMFTRDTASLSNTVPEESDFRRVIGTETSGELARFLEDKMRVLVWLHPGADAPIVFGAQLDREKLVETLQSSLQIPDIARDSWDNFSRSRSSDSGFCAAILDDTGHPVALSRPGFTADWKHPFVATEIGDVLPHWEAALYLADPLQFSRAARTLQWSFFLIVILLIAAIVAGGSFIGRDVRREMLLAQQKTDFVSNVSHELKTPLTSIRMFADLLAEKRVPDEERQATYLRIIAAEASRLTRLINNVLDFARLEKGAPHGEHAACDLVEAVRDVADTCGPHLEAAGVSFQCEIEAETLPIRGDRDALAQIILNLISNAEKYGGSDILVRVRRQEIATGALGCVDVLDRGAGIPARQVKTIFEPFRRLDDSLSSGIPGTGLGLTLARRMAQVHGGDVTYSARAGGGSCFTLAVPLV